MRTHEHRHRQGSKQDDEVGQAQILVQPCVVDLNMLRQPAQQEPDVISANAAEEPCSGRFQVLIKGEAAWPS